METNCNGREEKITSSLFKGQVNSISQKSKGIKGQGGQIVNKGEGSQFNLLNNYGDHPISFWRQPLQVSQGKSKVGQISLF